MQKIPGTNYKNKFLENEFQISNKTLKSRKRQLGLEGKVWEVEYKILQESFKNKPARKYKITKTSNFTKNSTYWKNLWESYFKIYKKVSDLNYFIKPLNKNIKATLDFINNKELNSNNISEKDADIFCQLLKEKKLYVKQLAYFNKKLNSLKSDLNVSEENLNLITKFWDLKSKRWYEIAENIDMINF